MDDREGYAVLACDEGRDGWNTVMVSLTLFFSVVFEGLYWKRRVWRRCLERFDASDIFLAALEAYIEGSRSCLFGSQSIICRHRWKDNT